MSKRTWLKAAIVAGMAILISPAMAGANLAQAAPPDSGDLVIHKYLGAVIPDTDRDGRELDTTAWTGVTPANGVVFELFKIGAPLPVTPPDTPWPDTPHHGTFVRNPDTGNLEVYSGRILIGEYATTPASSPVVTTAGNGTATATLDNGMYLVIENGAASTNVTSASTGEAMLITATAVPFLVSVPTADPSGTGWLDTVHVYPKNQGMTVDKVVDTRGAVAVGDKISYTITVSIPGDIATAKQFNIWDKLDAALDPVFNSVKVTTQPKLTGANALIQYLDWWVKPDDGSNTVTVIFQEKARAKLANASFVTVTFDAVVNDSILSAPGMTVPNVAHVEFTNSDGTEFDGSSNGGDESTIHTAAVSITKIDQNGRALNGASFKIASSLANAYAGNFIRQDGTGKLVDYDPAPASAWTTLGGTADYQIDPANQASFVGLRDYVEVNGAKVWQTYWVVEVVAPDSYNLLPAPLEVDFEAAYNKFLDPKDYDYTVTLTVTNAKGFVLPETGGAGTIIWTVAGVALIGTAILVGVTKRKKNATC